MTGPVVIDYKGDRIMDYQVWYLASGSKKFEGYMKIPLTKTGRNATACVEWLVKKTKYCVISSTVCRLLLAWFIRNDYKFFCAARLVNQMQGNDQNCRIRKP